MDKISAAPPGFSNRAAVWRSCLGSCTFAALQEIYDSSPEDQRTRLTTYELEICISNTEAHAVFASGWMNALITPDAVRVVGSRSTRRCPLRVPQFDPPEGLITSRVGGAVLRMDYAQPEREELRATAKRREGNGQLSERDAFVFNQFVMGSSFFKPGATQGENQRRENVYEKFWRAVDDPRLRAGLQRMPVIRYVERGFDEAERIHQVALACQAVDDWPTLKWVVKPSHVTAI